MKYGDISRELQQLMIKNEDDKTIKLFRDPKGPLNEKSQHKMPSWPSVRDYEIPKKRMVCESMRRFVWGKGRHLSVQMKFPGRVYFERHLSEWRMLSNFSFQHRNRLSYCVVPIHISNKIQDTVCCFNLV